MVGVCCMIWVYYYRNYVMIISRAKLSILNAKDAIINSDSELLLNATNLAATSSAANPNNTVPWSEIMTKLSFWLVNHLLTSLIILSSNLSYTTTYLPICCLLLFSRALIVAHVCQNNAYYILLTWLPTYFQENYPGSKVAISDSNPQLKTNRIVRIIE